MPYINADGSVSQERSWFRFSIITDVVWSIINEIGNFFQTLFDPLLVTAGASSSSSNQRNNNAPRYGGSKPSAPRGSNIKTLPKNCTTSR